MSKTFYNRPFVIQASLELRAPCIAIGLKAMTKLPTGFKNCQCFLSARGEGIVCHVVVSFCCTLIAIYCHTRQHPIALIQKIMHIVRVVWWASGVTLPYIFSSTHELLPAPARLHNLAGFLLHHVSLH